MTYIGIDLGSTYTKAALFDERRILSSLSVATPPPIATGVRYEIDARIYGDQVVAILEQLRDKDVQGILISTQMHGYVLCDESFNPLSPYVSWRDGMGARYLDVLRERYGADAVSPSGVPWKGNLAISALLARRQEGEVWPENAYFCTLGGYIIGRLTGKHACHMTNAAPSGMTDISEGKWNMPLIREVGLDSLKFPQLYSDMSVCGLWKGIPVYPDLGDQQVCAAGAELTAEKTLHISIGTAGLIGMLAVTPGTGNYEKRPWITPQLTLRTVSGLPGGRHLTALAQNLTEIVEELTGQKASEELVFKYLAACDGDPDQPCSEPWQLPSRNAVTFIQNIYESFAEAYDQAARSFGIPVQELSFSGGCVAKNNALRHRIVAHFGKPASEEDHDVWTGMRSIVTSVL